MSLCMPLIYHLCVSLNHNAAFVIKVWVAKQGGKFWLALERTIDLKKLMYIGNLVRNCNHLLPIQYIFYSQLKILRLMLLIHCFSVCLRVTIATWT